MRFVVVGLLGSRRYRNRAFKPLWCQGRGCATEPKHHQASCDEPSNCIYLAIGAKVQEFAIEIMINSVDEGDFGFPELPVS